MKGSIGELTPTQHEIVRLLWESKRPMTNNEIWQTIGVPRGLARTTIQTQVKRLEDRGWVRRVITPEGIAFEAPQGPDAAAGSLAARVLKGFFGGSPSKLFLSLQGHAEIDREEVARLRKLLDDWEERHGR